jgi:hypothetical protein
LAGARSDVLLRTAMLRTAQPVAIIATATRMPATRRIFIISPPVTFRDPDAVFKLEFPLGAIKSSLSNKKIMNLIGTMLPELEHDSDTRMASSHLISEAGAATSWPRQQSCGGAARRLRKSQCC